MSETSAFLFGDYGPRTLLRLSGPDAASYLHNLCTQDIRALKPGACSEAFITSVQGKTLGYVRIFRQADTILLETSPGQASTLLEHFDKYHIREKVEFADLSQHAKAFVASWDVLKSYLSQAGVAEPNAFEPSEGQFSTMDGPTETIIAHCEIAGAGLGYGVFIGSEAEARWSAFWSEVSGTTISAEELQARRIAAGTVEFGVDVTSENLPQELARDKKAISFQKGCYLGQETVARIDAMGHVNRLLVRLRGERKLALSKGDVIEFEGKPVGHITSAAFWEAKNETWALGLVRRGNHAPNTALSAKGQSLMVID